MNRAFLWVGKRLHTFIIDGGWRSILMLAALGIILAIIGYYGKNGFRWGWFLFLELPLYVFCGWAIWKGVVEPIRKNPDIFK